MQIREADAGDLELIVERRIEFLRSVREPDASLRPGFADETHAWASAEYEASRLHTWIAEDDSGFAGIVSLLLWPRPPLPEGDRSTEGYIVNMYVPAPRRGQGIGRRLLNECLASAERFGIRAFILHTTEAGRPLYESVGFASSSVWMTRPAVLSTDE